jgi:hypothetical protein
MTFLFILGSTQGVARACQCFPTHDPAIEYAQVDAAFMGVVLDISPSASPFYYDITIGVTGYWKGTVSQFTHVYTGVHGGSCGYSFELYSEYLIYAMDSTEDCCPGVFTSACQRTWLLSSAGYDLDFLGDPLPVPVEQVTWGVVKEMYRD